MNATASQPLALVVDYGMGNAQSVLNALESLGVSAVLSSAPADFARATHIILPGVGAFGDCMKELHSRGLLPLLEQAVRKDRKPYLGICLGMQILADSGEEGKITKGLGWIAGTVSRLSDSGKALRIPHVGWNDAIVRASNLLFKNITQPIFYFVHSFALRTARAEDIAAKTEYGELFTSAVAKENIFGVQFHPEKSQRAGLELLSNFMNLSSPWSPLTI